MIASVLRRVAVAGLLLAMLPLSASAAGLAPRSVQLGSSQPGVYTTNIVNVTVATTANISSIGFAYCTTASGACTTPAGVDTTGATLTAQSGATGFTIQSGVNGTPYFSRGTAQILAGTALSYTIANVKNPTAINTTFFIRIAICTGGDGVTGAVDTGTVAVSTAQQVQLTGVTPEILVFCVGTTVTGDCTTMTGSTIDFGDFSPVATRTGTSVMQAATNASGGYSITVNGTTLSSGVNTITALPAQASAVTGVGQYGLNLRANTSPAVGADPSTGAGALGTVTAAYNAQDQFRFINGDTVASAPAPTNSNTYTSSYIVNIGGAQPAGVYTATMTYICTANF